MKRQQDEKWVHFTYIPISYLIYKNKPVIDVYFSVSQAETSREALLIRRGVSIILRQYDENDV